MILYTWVGDDGLVRWSDELPDAKKHLRDTSAGVIGPCLSMGYDGYAVRMPDGDTIDPVPRLDMALVMACIMAHWDDV